jgi:putative MATE family efflux protein
VDSTPNHSLAQGNARAHLARLAVPLLVSAALNAAQGMIDLFWVAGLGTDALAALAVAGPILMQLFPVAMGVALGMMSLMSRAMGAGMARDAAQIGGRAIALSLLAGALVGLAGWLFSPWFCSLTDATPGVRRLATEYLQVTFLGTAAFMLSLVAMNICTSSGNTVLPMWGMFAANALNFLLDPILIYGGAGIPPLGVRGAAITTVISTIAGAAIMLYYYNRLPGPAAIRWSDCRMHWATSRQILKIGLPVSAQVLARHLMAFILMGIVSGYGDAALAGYGVGVRLHMLLLMPAFSLGNGAAPIVGQSLGAGLMGRAKQTSWLAVFSYAAILAVAMPSMTLFAPWCVRFFSHDPEVVTVGVQYLRIITPFFFFSGAAIILSRTLSSAGDTFVPMAITIVSLWFFQWPAAAYSQKFMVPPIHGIWWSIALASALHGILVAAWFMRGKWQTAARTVPSA